MHTRKSPISSRKRSTTIVLSEGTAPVAACWSWRNCNKFCAAHSSRPACAKRAKLAWLGQLTTLRENSPISFPNSYGRPTPSPFQNGTAPGTPGAGDTSTRSRVISSMRHVDAPSRNV